MLTSWVLLVVIFVAVQIVSLFTAPLIDDVDARHAQISQHMLDSGDWVTPQSNGIRYLEKPPLPFWLVSVSYLLAGQNSFATHLPNALAMFGLAWLAWLWGRRAWGPAAGLYAGLGVLTSIGPFLFTRFIIPESILSLLLLIALYSLLTSLDFGSPLRIYWMWGALALAVLTKGLLAPVLFAGGAIPYLLISRQWKRWRSLRPITGMLLFFAIAAPWHILVGLANPDQGHPVGNHPTIGNVHGFWWFYFVNEQFLRFTNQRYPHDYNKLPFAAFWLLQLVWLFPWSLYLPAFIAVGWKTRTQWLQSLKRPVSQTTDGPTEQSQRPSGSSSMSEEQFRVRTIWLLSLFSAFGLVFFSISSNLEYYTFPLWPPLLLLIAGAIVTIETQGESPNQASLSPAWLMGAQWIFALLGLCAAAVLGWELWASRKIPFVADVGTMLAHRGVGDYTLAMSHFFDLTGPSFAALRLPSILAAITMLVGPAAGWLLRLQRKHLQATASVALTSALFLVAAYIAFARFSPMLSSKQMADTIMQKGSPEDTFIIFGEQSDAASVLFYTHAFFHRKPGMLVLPRCGQNGEGSTLLWGSCYPDAPDIFLSNERLASIWGSGERKWLFAQGTNQVKAEQILQGRLYLVQTIADKDLWTDRPLAQHMP